MIAIFKMLFIVFITINLEAGVVDWTIDKTKEKSKEKMKGYVVDKYNGYRKVVRKQEDEKGTKGMVSKIEDKKEEITTSTKKQIREKSDLAIGKNNVNNIIEKREQIIDFKDQTKQKAINYSINTGTDLIGKQNSEKVRKVVDYKNQKATELDKSIIKKTENLLGRKVE